MAGEGTDRCTRAREWASLRVDGELSELERLLLRRHLSRCESCRTFAEQLTATSQLLRTAPVERPSRALVPEVRPVRRRKLGLRVALAGALVVIAAATGGVVGSIVGGGDGGSSPTQPNRDIALRPDTSTVPIPPPTTPSGENV
jgi:predicted anti-sigma-YlaC factor YlaD